MRDFEQRLHILEHTYPAWSNRRRPHAWIAIRVTAAGSDQPAARDILIEPDLDALVSALSQQLLVEQEPEAVSLAIPRAA